MYSLGSPPRDWATSSLTAPGDQVNVDFGDLLDLFAADGATRAYRMRDDRRVGRAPNMWIQKSAGISS
jgi:hypothetical protein